MIMTNEFVNFKIAKKLQEKGFREKCLAYYTPYAGILKFNTINVNKRPSNYELNLTELYECYNSYVENYIDAPTISQVLKWLREEKKLHIMIDIWKVDLNNTTYKWGYDIVNLTTTHVEGSDIQCANSFEEAALAGIEYILDNLI